MKEYPKFNVLQFIDPYKGINPEIKKIRDRFLSQLPQTARLHISNKEYQQFLHDTDLNQNFPKYILMSKNLRSYVIAVTLGMDNKKFKKIKFIDIPDYPNNTITIHDDFEFEMTDFENELLLKNYKFEGHFFRERRWYEIGEKTGKYLKEKFNIKDRTPDKVLVDGIIAETDEKYLLMSKTPKQGKYIYFWVYKDEIGDLYQKQWEQHEVDFDSINKLNTKGYSLYPFQEKGVQFLYHEKYGFLLYDQGMGKTMTSIAAAIHVNAKKVLVVTLASLKVNWKREVEAMSQTAKIINGSEWNDDDAKFTIINYEILKNFHKIPKGRKPKNWVEESKLLDEKFDVIILDEGHKCKSQKSQRSKIINVLAKAKHTKYLWVLSGTLIEKNEDFFNVCKVINCPIKGAIVIGDYSTEYKCYYEYQTRYCNKIPIKKTINGVKKEILITPKVKGEKIENINTHELRQRVKHKIYRVIKTRDLDGFVEKHRIPLYFELSEKEMKKYDKLFDDYLEEKAAQGIQTSEDAARLTESIKLRQYLADVKVPHTVAFAKSLFEDEEKVIIFTHFKSEFEKIVKKLGKKVVSVKSGSKNNQDAIDAFQNDPNVLGIVGNILTLGTGHNLTKGDNVIINSPNWNSGEHAQAEDRAWRLGRTEDVNVYYMLFENTEEEVVFNRSENKKGNKEIFFDE
jgi:SWI/SNF-related matrix-associated actin-dependent regulator 1 of chromatin subfamily A